MALPPPISDPARKTRGKTLQQTRYIVLATLSILLILCIVFTWDTRDAMLRLPFLGGSPQNRNARPPKAIVDLSPWQTAQALRALAVSSEEIEFAREAERLADHEVDQAFASALREATMKAQHRKFTGDALVLSQKIDQLQQLVNQDQAQVNQLTSAAAGPPPGTKASAQAQPSDTDLDIAKAQLQLDSDQLDDAQRDLARASGDNRDQIQSELTAHEAAMRKYDAESSDGGQIAVLSVGQTGTLTRRIGAWNRQRSRYQLIQQAIKQAQADVRTLSDQHNALEAQANANLSPSGSDAETSTSRLNSIRNRAAQRQLLSIYDDRIQTQQELAAVYAKWSDQLLRQHRIVLHLILQSTAVILFILICIMVGTGLVRRLMSRPNLDRRQSHALRLILESCIRVFGAVLILFVIFGTPRQLSTVLGLSTAALTIALQDFILAFFGWFRLVGKRGIAVGDWVEINGVSGEVIEVGMMTTTLLETGSFAARGYPTGRRITFINNFAIRGQYFNFSTTGQWMWDEITVGVPASVDTHDVVERVLHTVQEETQESTHLAEQEWKRVTHGDDLGRFRMDPAVNLRPSASGFDLEVRYVTRASERFEVRDRLSRKVLELVQESPHPAQPESVR